MKLWYFSFADNDGWLGGAYIEAPSLEVAVTRSHREGFNPGGDIQAIELPPDAERLVGPSQRNRLLKKHELGVADEDEVVRWRAEDGS